MAVPSPCAANRELQHCPVSSENRNCFVPGCETCSPLQALSRGIMRTHVVRSAKGASEEWCITRIAVACPFLACYEFAMPVNPYSPPQEDIAGQPSPVISPKTRTNLCSLVLPTVGGAVVGRIFLAPQVVGPGDPTGQSIGAGLGGLAALFCAIVIRNFWRLYRDNKPLIR